MHSCRLALAWPKNHFVCRQIDAPLPRKRENAGLVTVWHAARRVLPALNGGNGKPEQPREVRRAAELGYDMSRRVHNGANVNAVCPSRQRHCRYFGVKKTVSLTVRYSVARGSNAAMTNTSQTLWSLRRRAKLSRKELARLAGYAGPSSYQHFEEGDYDGPKKLPMQAAHKIAAALEGRGSPPIAAEEIYALSDMPKKKSGVSPNAVTGGFPTHIPARENEGSEFTADNYLTMLEVSEVDVRASAGDGALVVEDGAVVGRWVMPKTLIEAHTLSARDHLRILQIVGDSMAPEFQPGERVMVDLSDKTPSPPGVFVLWDGLGLVVKRVEYIPDPDRPAVRLISANTAYATREVPLLDCQINGRVIGKWNWT